MFAMDMKKCKKKILNDSSYSFHDESMYIDIDIYKKLLFMHVQGPDIPSHAPCPRRTLWVKKKKNEREGGTGGNK